MTDGRSDSVCSLCPGTSSGVPRRQSETANCVSRLCVFQMFLQRFVQKQGIIKFYFFQHVSIKKFNFWYCGEMPVRIGELIMNWEIRGDLFLDQIFDGRWMELIPNARDLLRRSFCSHKFIRFVQIQASVGAFDLSWLVYHSSYSSVSTESHVEGFLPPGVLRRRRGES